MRRHAQKVRVKVAEVRFTGAQRNVAGLDLLGVDILPVEMVGKVSMCAQFKDTPEASTKAIQGVSLQQTGNEVHGFWIKLVWEQEIVIEHSVVHFFWRVCSKRRDANHHFIQHGTKAPEISSIGVFLVLQDNLGCQVFGGAAECGCAMVVFVVAVCKHLGQAEISQDNMAIRSQQHIFRLQVSVVYGAKMSIFFRMVCWFGFFLPVQDAMAMELLKPHYNFGSIKAALFSWEADVSL